VVHDQAQLADLLVDTGRRSEAETLYREALPRAERLARDHPIVLQYRNCVPRVCIALGNLFHATGHSVEAEKQFRRAIRLREKMVEDFPARSDVYDELAHLLSNCPVESLRDPQRARALTRRAREVAPREDATTEPARSAR
jgi:hypothetical protein